MIVTVPIPIVYYDEASWTVGSVWGPQQLANSDEYHIRLFKRLWEGRGAYKRFIQKELQSSFDQIQQQVRYQNLIYNNKVHCYMYVILITTQSFLIVSIIS